MESPPILSLVIPCYNEGRNVSLLLDRLAPLAQGAPELEFIVVDNGSTDGTELLFPAAGHKHPRIRTLRVERNQGYGYGILCGLGAARGGSAPPCPTAASLTTACPKSIS